MKRKTIYKMLPLLLGAALLWPLFGWRHEDAPSRGALRYQRVLGRSVVVSVDEDRDGRADGRYIHSWFRPADEPGSKPIRYREDHNGDGVWDVWVRAIGKNKYGDDELEFQVDTTGDGKPDWKFKSLDALSGYQAIVETRGY